MTNRQLLKKYLKESKSCVLEVSECLHVAVPITKGLKNMFANCEIIGRYGGKNQPDTFILHDGTTQYLFTFERG